MRPLLLGLLLAASATAQPADVIGPWRVYVEGLGNGGVGSLNLERQVSERVALRGGVGYLPGYVESWFVRGFIDFDEGAVSLPLMVTLTPGGASGLELGAGVVFRRVVTETGDGSRLLTATVGYRWVTSAGDIFRVGFTPLFLARNDPNRIADNVVPSVGFSVGTGL